MHFIIKWKPTELVSRHAISESIRTLASLCPYAALKGKLQQLVLQQTPTLRLLGTAASAEEQEKLRHARLSLLPLRVQVPIPMVLQARPGRHSSIPALAGTQE